MPRANCRHIYPPIDLYNHLSPRCDIVIVSYFDLSPQVEGGQQHLLIDQQNPMALARRPSTDFLPLVGYKEYRVLDLHLLSSFFYRCLPP